ncbi:MAG: SufD family Fe-S cluster assembly protein [Mollicutes bacterium]|nr:SufD family Fe-S cluster assembly protein [Mollicutes bacterium]
MNRIIDVKEREKVFYDFDTTNQDVIYNVSENSKLVVYQYGINIDNNIIINLNGENASVEYHYSTINYDDHKYKIDVNHNNSKTISNIYNHGINVFDNKLDFDITGNVLNKSDKCECNQKNQILNISDGKSTILPKLLIDNYDVISSHSAYIGKFKDEILFYLMSRGISEKVSYDLLIKSFLVNGCDNTELIEKLEKEIDKI